MRVNPVASAGRANVRRKRPSMGETESERQGKSFASYLPEPPKPDLERDHDVFNGRYYPNSVFLAHLIATRDYDIQTRQARPAETLSGANSYRAMAALPRQRGAGHLLKTER
ncbi:hypothetical protein [uncultured Roseibium sp.]|uniref:hypothetical protein n=1 Tax=uncultured Roseibium sp. TaxID=1936171 RepID=UPI00262DA62F|nr:hypothetical protein [uncultured Roseibium sp.]